MESVRKVGCVLSLQLGKAPKKKNTSRRLEDILLRRCRSYLLLRSHFFMGVSSKPAVTKICMKLPEEGHTESKDMAKTYILCTGGSRDLVGPVKTICCIARPFKAACVRDSYYHLTGIVACCLPDWPLMPSPLTAARRLRWDLCCPGTSLACSTVHIHWSFQLTDSDGSILSAFVGHCILSLARR